MKHFERKRRRDGTPPPTEPKRLEPTPIKDRVVKKPKRTFATIRDYFNTKPKSANPEDIPLPENDDDLL